jgi:Tol biopolymer transport system component
VLPDFASVAWPVWSPDGRRLLVSARRTIPEDPAWWVVAPDNRAPVKSRGVTVVVPGAAGFPVRPWTWIEGNRIVYSAALGGDSWDLWEVALVPDTWVVTSEPRRLTTGADLQTHASIVGGTRLVFSSLTQTINVWSLPLGAKDGRVAGPARRVTSTSTHQWWPSVSEDGRRLVFRGEKGGLWIRELDTDREVLLVSSQQPVIGSITADGSRVAYVIYDNNWKISAVPSSGGVPETLCVDCDAPEIAWSRDSTRLLYASGNPSEVFVLDLRSGEKRRVLHRPPSSLWEARFSPDDRWISVLEVQHVEGRSRVWIAPLRDESSPAANEWVGVTSGEHWDDKPRWSLDGTLMYFTSLRDGFHCLWAQRLRPDTKQPTGPPFSVEHFHNPRLSMTNTGVQALGVEIARDQIFINLGELSGNIWTTVLR